MVMDATPSPQCVGREFVRQYYTLLNEAPQFLHRFYSNNSSFIHGGEAKPGEDEQKPVIGQTDIHKKIMSLNFKDCHAKIRYVDSQSTISTGVVVQVTGELSNNQEPLRRFMQTFVLAPQTPNKYYVHNDIFRYQDEVFADSDEDEDLVEEDHLANQVPEKQAPSHEPVSQPAHMEGHQENNVQHIYHQQMVAEHEMAGQVNGRGMMGVSEQSMSNGHQQEAASPPPSAVQPEEPIERPRTPEPVETPATPESPPEASPEPVGRVEVHPPAHQQPADEPEPPSELPKPRSWANIAHVSAGSGPASSATPASQQHTAFPSHAESASTEQPPSSSHRVGNPMRNNRPGASLGTDHRAFGDTVASSKARGDDGRGGDDRRSDKIKYPDSQQVFVGNLPSMIAEFELRDFFRNYGNVLEVRINRSSPNKLHFGFVVFESDAVAQKVLAYKSLEYNGHRLNIEEKKPRSDSRPHSSSRHSGRRDGPRHMRSGRSGGYSGPQRDDGDGRGEHGRFNNLNKSSQHRR